MFSNIVTAGNVGAVVEPFAAQAASTPEGARWLNAYIDPAHGNCDTYPDEDNIYSTPLKSHFTFTLDRGFWVGETSYTVPPNHSFTVYLTNFPDYPMAVYGRFYYGTTYRDQLVFIPDPNLSDVIHDGSAVQGIRFMYKGSTLRYVGNQWSNEGVVTTAQFAFPKQFSPTSYEWTGDDGNTFTSTVSTINERIPTSSGGIASSNKDFYVNRQDNGVYASNQIMGARSEYIYRTAPVIPNMLEPVVFAAPYTAIRTVENRFETVATTGQRAFPGSEFPLNCTWVVMRFDGLNFNQSILIEHFGGYQVHAGYNSSLVNFQSFKSYLDPAALAVASQLTASLPMIWPAAYNDFRQVWRKITRFLGSSTGQGLINTIAGISGKYGGLVSAIGGLF